MKTIILASLAAFMLVLTIGGCNTVRGAGEDLNDAADATEDALD